MRVDYFDDTVLGIHADQTCHHATLSASSDRAASRNAQASDIVRHLYIFCNHSLLILFVPELPSRRRCIGNIPVYIDPRICLKSPRGSTSSSSASTLSCLSRSSVHQQLLIVSGIHNRIFKLHTYVYAAPILALKQPTLAPEPHPLSHFGLRSSLPVQAAHSRFSSGIRPCCIQPRSF